MKLVLSPAKSLDLESKVPTKISSEACFLARSKSNSKWLLGLLNA